MAQEKNRGLIRHIIEGIGLALSDWGAQEPLSSKSAEGIENRARSAGRGGEIHAPINMSIAAKIREIETWVSLAVGLIGTKLAYLPVRVGDNEVNLNGESVFIPDADSDYAEFLNNPHSDFSINDQMNWLIQSALLTSVGYLEIIREPDGKPTGLFPLVSGLITPTTDASGIVVSYVYSVGGLEQIIPAENVIVFKEINISNPSQGFSELQPLREVILTNIQLRTFTRKFLENGAVPAGVLTTDHKFLDDDTIRRVSDEWFDKHGGTNAGRIAVLHAGLTWQQTQLDMSSIGVDVIRNMNRDEILGLFHIPPIYGGIFDKANYANAREQKILLWEFLSPRKMMIEQAFDRHLGKPYFEGMVILLDTSGIEALKPDRLEQASIGVTVWNAGLVTMNEARTKFLQMSPIDDDELGEAFRSSPEPVAFIPNAGMKEDPDPEKDDPVDGDSKFLKILSTLQRRIYTNTNGSTAPNVSRTEKVKASRQRSSHLRFLKALERTNRKDVNKFFQSQKRRILSAVTELNKSGVFRSALVSECWKMKQINPLKYKIRQIKGDPPKPSELTLLFDLQIEQEAVEAMMGTVANRSIASGGRRALENVGIEAPFDPQSIAAQALAVKAKNLSTRINGVTFAAIKGLLEQSEREGQTVNQLSKNIRGLFDNWTGRGAGEERIHRSRRIALTESTRNSNGAANVAWKENDITHKRWLTIIDGETREEHIAADFEKVGIDEQFIQTGESLDYPADANASPWNSINCRCGMVGELSDDEIRSRNYGDICQKCDKRIMVIDNQSTKC